MPDMVNGGITVQDVQPGMVDFYKRAGYKVVETVETPVDPPVVPEEVKQDLDPASEEPVIDKQPVKKAVHK